jgi:hypothetical protein
MNPPELPNVICCEIGCADYRNRDEIECPKDCLKCYHNVKIPNRESLEDKFKSPIQKGWY